MKRQNLTLRMGPIFRLKWECAGFSVVSAIFLLVVLATLSVAMVNISTVQQSSSALDVQGARAYHAAQAGIEWGVYRQIRGNSCVASTSFALPSGTTISSFSTTVTCALTLTGGASTTILSAAANVATATTATAHGLVFGDQITMINAVPATYNGTYLVTSVPSATTFTYGLASTPAGASVQGLFGRTGLSRWRITSTACNQPSAGNVCPNLNPSPDYMQRVLQVEF